MLVTAAAGGLGALLVQEVRAAGAMVVAAARGPAKLHALGRFDPDAVVDYSEPDWIARTRAVTGGVQVVFDGAGGVYGRAAFDLVRDGGRFSAHGTPAGEFAVPDPDAARARGITVTGIADLQFTPGRARRHLRSALDAAAAGRITPLVGQTYPLDRAADAHRAIEQRSAVGKVLLTV